jgi:Putative outer membrane beta-barrel porin, MtrB/PioB
LNDTGFKDMKLKLRYMWERNAVKNWQNDPLAPYTSSVSTSALWMDYDNPNYNVQAVSASLIVKW